MHVKTRNLLVRYLIVYILAFGLVQVLALLLERFAADIGSPSGLAFVPSIIAAMEAGQNYFKTHNERPTNGYAWKTAVMFTLISVAVSALVVAALGALDFPIMEMIAEAGPQTLATILAVLLLLHILISRLMFGMGAKTMAKQAQK